MCPSNSICWNVPQIIFVKMSLKFCLCEMSLKFYLLKCPLNSICWNVPQILFVEIPIFISIAGSLLVDQSTSGVLVSVRGRGRGVTQIQFRPNSVGGCVGEKRNQQQVLSLFHRRPRFLFTRCKFAIFFFFETHLHDCIFSPSHFLLIFRCDLWDEGLSDAL